MMQHNNIGLVLCGGQSTRMGQDKGRLRHQGQSWAERAGHLLAAQGLPVYYSIHALQRSSYPAHLAYIVDNPTLNIGGPLKGLLSAHVQFPQAGILVLACDLRDMESPVLAYLQACHQPGAVTIFTQAGRDEPLAGLYPAPCLEHLYRLLPLPRHSMQYALQQLPVQRLTLPQKWQTAFTNFNTPSI